jgi:hypothetical protein
MKRRRRKKKRKNNHKHLLNTNDPLLPQPGEYPYTMFVIADDPTFRGERLQQTLMLNNIINY